MSATLTSAAINIEDELARIEDRLNDLRPAIEDETGSDPVARREFAYLLSRHAALEKVLVEIGK